MNDAKVFIGGFFPKPLGEKDPEFVMGKGSINVDNMIASLEECRKYADNGWLNYQIFQSKKDPSKRYAQLNLWKPPTGSPAPKDERFNFKKEEPLPIVDVNADLDVSGIPF